MEVAAGYERLLRSIKAESPSTHVFMQSVIPVNERLTSEPIANRTVRALNENLRVVARAEGAEFLDVSSALSEQAGELDARLTRDGIYLDGAGYAAWAEVLLGLER